MRSAFVFDPDRCTGCEACRIACGNENGNGRDTGWRQIHTFNPAHHPALPTRHLSLACNHCQRPACLLGCPASAYRRDATTGAVVLHVERCFGCRYCAWLCPYDAPRFDAPAGVMRKCTFCESRLRIGQPPACAQACPTGALSIASLDTVSSEPEALGLMPLGFRPALVVRDARRSAPPRGQVSEQAATEPPRQPLPPRKIRLANETSLVAFTLLLPALVAWFGAGLIHPGRGPSLLTFLLVGGLALAWSSLHLGRPLRAWRAVSNLMSSWLSREVFFAIGFLVIGAVHLALDGVSLAAPAPSSLRTILGLLALVFGVASLLSIDAVYRVVPRADPRHHQSRLHSGETWLTGLLLLGFAAESAPVWAGAATIKAALQWRFGADSAGVAGVGRLPRFAMALRVGCLAGAAILATANVAWYGPALLAFLGEVIDRCRFYLELEPTSPGWEMVFGGRRPLSTTRRTERS